MQIRVAGSTCWKTLVSEHELACARKLRPSKRAQAGTGLHNEAIGFLEYNLKFYLKEPSIKDITNSRGWSA